MIAIDRRGFLAGSGAFLLAPGALAASGRFGGVAPWENPDGTASDSVMCRRMYLDLAGRIPTADEARAYVGSKNPCKRAELIDTLLASEDFAHYWTMRFADILCVKAEFPVNLWPNAVYVYNRRIRSFVRDDEPWDHFGRALVLGQGSDFRDPESNFYRATSVRTPAGWAAEVTRVFLGFPPDAVDECLQKCLKGAFDNLRIKTTREWKEEVVYVEGDDRRVQLADELFKHRLADVESAFALRVREWIFGPGYVPCDHVVLAGGLRLKEVLRRLLLSSDYAAGSATGAFPMRRLDAEVLDDAIRTLSGLPRNLQSAAPEPFTYLPPDRESIEIEDGSISNGFLTLFGRPARDTGEMGERDNSVSAKQRLLLFNSDELHRQLGKIVSRPLMRKLKSKEVLGQIYWDFLGREPTREERKVVNDARPPRGEKGRWLMRDVAWALLNSREFLFRI